MKSILLTALLLVSTVALAQVAPRSAEIAAYRGLLADAASGDVASIKRHLAGSADLEVRDSYGRTPLHVAAFRGHHRIMRELAAAGADVNALEDDRYDMVTIAAVADDLATLELALVLGTSPGNVTSRYDGTALIAAAHLGHVEIVQALIEAGAPLDHVNNLGWTALIESIVLGDGGMRHTETLRLLVTAGADVNLADRAGTRPLQLARRHGYTAMTAILEASGAD